MRYSFTGVTEFPDPEAAEESITNTLLILPEPEEVYTGGALGVDTLVQFIAQQVWPNADHYLCLPTGAPYNQEVLRSGLPTLLSSEGSTVAESYMLRNDLLVNRCDELIAFPLTEEEIMRSGTWATIRRARKADKPVRIFALL